MAVWTYHAIYHSTFYDMSPLGSTFFLQIRFFFNVLLNYGNSIPLFPCDSLKCAWKQGDRNQAPEAFPLWNKFVLHFLVRDLAGNINRFSQIVDESFEKQKNKTVSTVPSHISLKWLIFRFRRNVIMVAFFCRTNKSYGSCLWLAPFNLSSWIQVFRLNILLKLELSKKKFFYITQLKTKRNREKKWRQEHVYHGVASPFLWTTLG